MTSHLRSAVLPIALFALGFAGVALPLSLGLRAVSPAPDMMMLSPKLEAYRQGADTIDTVFVGSSRTNYHIVPDVVEQGAAEAGCPDWNVVNLGVFGLTGAEEDWLVSRILATEGEALKRVVIEDALPNGKTLKEVTTDRARFFNSPDMWPAQAGNIASYPESLPKRAFRSALLVAGTGFDLSGVGRGAALLFPAPETSPPFGFDMSQGGFEALRVEMGGDVEARHADFEAQPEKFDADLARYGAASSEDVAARARYLAERLDRLSARGLTAALYVSPDLAELDRTPRTGEAVRALPGERVILNFNRPDVYPDLFQREMWFDFSHLNETGARKLSAEVGRDLCRQTLAEKDTAAYVVR